MRRLYKSKQDKISQYNTFQVFENFYGGQSAGRLDTLEMPVEQNSFFNLWAWLLGIFLLSFIAVTFHPVLSYFLKTPYPLIVISDNSLMPLLKPGDIVLSQGIISPQEIKPNDLIIFYSLNKQGQKHFFVRQVKTVRPNQFIVVGLRQPSPEQTIGFKNIRGRLIGNQQPFKLPLVGKLILFWHKLT